MTLDDILRTSMFEALSSDNGGVVIQVANRESALIRLRALRKMEPVFAGLTFSAAKDHDFQIWILQVEAIKR